ncbi:MAG: hypothetical protein HZB39_20775 [Planctomycetes bacterium]|nr:hypothetical protein [Planctomycetota bacterium]
MTTFWRRLLLGAVLAAAAIVALDASLRAPPAEAAHGRSRSAAPFVTTPAPDELVVPATIPSGCAWLIYLAADERGLSKAVAPIVALDEHGGVRLVRAAPASVEPGSRDWLAAGLVLPVRRLVDLAPRTRAALLEVLRRWRGGTAMPLRSRLVLAGIHDAEALAVLSRHVR